MLPLTIILGIVSACGPSQFSQQVIVNSTLAITEQPTPTQNSVLTTQPPTASLLPTDTATPEITRAIPQCEVITDHLNICTTSPYENLFVKGMIFTPQGRNIDGTWLQVEVEENKRMGWDQMGWVEMNSELIDCGSVDISGLPTDTFPFPKEICSPVPSTSIGIIASITAIQPGSKKVTLTIQRADEAHTFFISLAPVSIVDDNGKTYEFDCDLVNNCAWHQLASEKLPYQIDGVLAQPIDTSATQVTITLKVDRAETGIPYFLTWQQEL